MSVHNRITLFISLFYGLVLIPLLLFSQVTFSEIMFDVEGVDYHDEFIEIFNLSGTDSIDLSGWQVSDSSHLDQLVNAGQGMVLQPHQFAVILDGSYFENSSTYDGIIPDSARIIKIDDNAFGQNGLSNSEAKRLSLLDAQGHEIDSYQYTLDNEAGYSDEKIILKGDNTIQNWANSIRKGGTPGYRNSIMPYDFDLALQDHWISYRPSFLVQTQQVLNITCYVTNSGLNIFTAPIDFELFIDLNRDSVVNADDIMIVSEATLIDLEAGATLEFNGQWIPESAGSFMIRGIIRSTADQNPFNNFRSSEILVVESGETAKINEIKFLTWEAEPEWLELINAGDTRVSLKDWAIADLKDTCWIDSIVILSPGQYKVFAADLGLSKIYGIPDTLICLLSDLPNFNNAGDIVYLLDPAGGWVEQVPYTVEWLEGQEWRNPSLERINYTLDSRIARNWGPSTAVEAATPGRQNSLFTSIRPTDLKVQIKPNPFSPDADGFEDHTIISVESPLEAARLRVDIYDVLGHAIRSIRENSFMGSRLDLVWDGRDDQGKIVRLGIYIVFVQILNDREGLLKEYKATVVVARRL